MNSLIKKLLGIWEKSQQEKDYTSCTNNLNRLKKEDKKNSWIIKKLEKRICHDEKEILREVLNPLKKEGVQIPSKAVEYWLGASFSAPNPGFRQDLSLLGIYEEIKEYLSPECISEYGIKSYNLCTENEKYNLGHGFYTKEYCLSESFLDSRKRVFETFELPRDKTIEIDKNFFKSYLEQNQPLYFEEGWYPNKTIKNYEDLLEVSTIPKTMSQLDLNLEQTKEIIKSHVELIADGKFPVSEKELKEMESYFGSNGKGRYIQNAFYMALEFGNLLSLKPEQKEYLINGFKNSGYFDKNYQEKLLAQI